VSIKLKVGPLSRGKVRPQVAGGGVGPQIWRVSVNMLNKQSWTADMGWFSSFDVGRGANTSP
jgi:hypothetical protein